MWRNGRRNGLKIRWAIKARAGSSPAIGSFDTDCCRVLANYRSCGFRIAESGFHKELTLDSNGKQFC